MHGRWHVSQGGMPGRGHCGRAGAWDAPPQQILWLWHTANERAVRILLECILLVVVLVFTTSFHVAKGEWIYWCYLRIWGILLLSYFLATSGIGVWILVHFTRQNISQFWQQKRKCWTWISNQFWIIKSLIIQKDASMDTRHCNYIEFAQNGTLQFCHNFRLI